MLATLQVLGLNPNPKQEHQELLNTEPYLQALYTQVFCPSVTHPTDVSVFMFRCFIYHLRNILNFNDIRVKAKHCPSKFIRTLSFSYLFLQGPMVRVKCPWTGRLRRHRAIPNSMLPQSYLQNTDSNIAVVEKENNDDMSSGLDT